MFKVLKSGKRGKKSWKRMITKVTCVGPGFTRKPPKYERFIRPTGAQGRDERDAFFWGHRVLKAAIICSAERWPACPRRCVACAGRACVRALASRVRLPVPVRAPTRRPPSGVRMHKARVTRHTPQQLTRPLARRAALAPSFPLCLALSAQACA